MEHVNDDNLDLPAGDSFLDVIANLVGILVLLVVIVGVRSASKAYESVAPPEAVDLDTLQQQIAERENDLKQAVRDARLVSKQIVQVSQDAEVREQFRLGAAISVAELKQDIADQREKLDPDRQQSAEVQIEIAKVQKALDDLTAKQVALIGQIAQMEEAPAQELEIAGSSIAANRKYKPTTIFMRGGSVVPQPGDEVVDQIRAAARSLPTPNMLKGRQEFERQIGPIDGFMIDIVFEQGAVRRGGAVAASTRLKRCLLNMNGDLVQWEPVDVALQPGSWLMSHLAGVNAEETAVILQPAPDSYEEYQLLKRRLSELGYSVVMRPMDDSGILPVVDSPEDGYAVQ